MKDCGTFFAASATSWGPDEVKKVCAMPQLATWNISSFEYLIDICWHPYDQASLDFMIAANLTDLGQLLELCSYGQDSQGFALWLNQTEQVFYGHYNCSANFSKCTKHEIALKQWARSDITRNPPAGLSQFANKKSFTGRDWFPQEELFVKPYEMMYFINEFPTLFSMTGKSFKGFTDEQANFLLSYDNLYNSIMISRAFLNFKNNDIDQFFKLFKTDAAKELIYYLRYVVIELAWGGFVQERSVHDILWGYDDPFVKKL